MRTTAGVFQACCPTNAFGETVHGKTDGRSVFASVPETNRNLLIEAANSIISFLLGHNRSPNVALKVDLQCALPFTVSVPLLSEWGQMTEVWLIFSLAVNENAECHPSL